MLNIILGATAQFALVTVVGLSILALVPAGRARCLLPAAPVFGVAYLVVALSLVGFVLPARTAAWIVVPAVVVAAIAVTVSRATRGRGWRRTLPAPREWMSWLATLVIGALAGVIAILPSIYARTALVVQPTANNDAFFYVEVTRWLLDHPLSQLPDIGPSPAAGLDSPAFGPAYESLATGLRVGQGYVRGTLSALIGLDPVAGFSPILGVWVVLVPAGAWVLGQAFRMSTISRLAMSAVLAFSYSLTFQVLNQNGDSVLGMSLLLAAIGLVAMAMNRHGGPPRWLAALVLAALAGTYTEFAPFAATAIAGILLFRRRGSHSAAVRGLAIVLGLSVLMAPVIWFRAVKSLFFVGGLATSGGDGGSLTPSLLVNFLGPYAPIWRGVDSANAGVVSSIAVTCFAIAVAAGVLLACAAGRSRGFAVGVLAGMGIAAVVVIRSDDYIGGRAVAMVTPLVLAAAVMGWWSVPGWLGSERRRVSGRVAGAAALALCVGLAWGGAQSSVRTINALEPSVRAVSPAYEEIADRANRLSDHDGAEITVVTATLFEQLWMSDALAAEPDVAYPNIRGDLGYRGNGFLTSFWDGELDPFVVVGPGAFVEGRGLSPVCSYGPFALVDMQQDAVVAVPMITDGAGVAPGWYWVADAVGGVPSAAPGDVLILTSRQSLNAVSIQIAGAAPGSTIHVSQAERVVSSAVADQDGRASLPLASAALSAGAARVTLSVESAVPAFVFEGISVR